MVLLEIILFCDYKTKSSIEHGDGLLQDYKEKEGLSLCSSCRDFFCFASKHLLYSTRSATPWYNHDTTSRRVEGLLLRTRGSQREETDYSRFLQRHSQ